MEYVEGLNLHEEDFTPDIFKTKPSAQDEIKTAKKADPIATVDPLLEGLAKAMKDDPSIKAMVKSTMNLYEGRKGIKAKGPNKQFMRSR